LAIYHCSVRTISRADNHSAVAAAAYRSGSVLKDERTGQSHNYRNRKGIVDAFILLPPHAPAAYADRLTLWNAAESAEKRKNSRVAREVILALPHELSEGQRLALTRDMALFLVEKYGVAVDAAVHAPQEAKGDDPRNHHAHLLFLTRVVEQNGLGEKTRILDDKEQGPQQIELIRSVWESLANAALQQAGFEAVKIDRRTLEDQGIDRIPQEHVGKVGTHEKAEADDTEEPRKKDEEDEDGETDTGKGKAGAGDSKGQAPSAAKKDSSPSSKEKAAPAQTRAETRLGLNEEIKKLNAQRAAFSPVPLKDQIKELDRLMGRLDGRVQRLKMLSQKTSLPVRVLSLVKSLINTAKSLIVVRTKDEAVRLMRTAEREAKAERQRARYGTTYRAHISERMTEMRQNIEILQTRKMQYYNYKSFVELVEGRAKLVYSTLKTPALPARTEWKSTASPQALKTKNVNEAVQKREKIPIEYKPTFKSEPLVKNFKAALSTSVSPLAITQSTKPIQAMLKGEDFKRPEKSFTAAATAPPKDNSARAVWHKEVTIKIQSLDKIRSDRAAIIIKEPMDSQKVWLVEANQRGRAILDRMQADIREQKAEIYKPNVSNFSGKFNHPTKIITEDEVIQKTRTEAKAARAKVPPDMRAEPYSFEDAKTATPESGFSKGFKTAGQNTAEEKKPKMSSAFNTATKADSAAQEPEPPEPKAKI
jgi:hypothetical protein